MIIRLLKSKASGVKGVLVGLLSPVHSSPKHKKKGKGQKTLERADKPFRYRKVIVS